MTAPGRIVNDIIKIYKMRITYSDIAVIDSLLVY